MGIQAVNVPLRGDMEARESDRLSIEAGDIVFHEPSGEEWVVLGVREAKDELIWMGWPPGYAKLSDCKLVEKGNGLTESERRERQMGYGSGWDDERDESGDEA